MFGCKTKESILCIFDDLASSDETSSAGSDQTDLLSGWRVTGNSGSVTNMLMITTTVRMLKQTV